MRANESNPDPNTSAVVAAAAVLLALLARQRFGVGQAVYVNMLAANMYANADDAVDVRRQAGRARRATTDLLGPARRVPPLPHRATAGCSSPSTSDDEWQRCWSALDRPELANDARFADADARAANDDALVDALAETLLRAAGGRVGGALRAPPASPAFAPTPRRLGRSSPTTRRCWPTTSRPSARTPASVRTAAGGRSCASTAGSASYGPGVLAGEQTDEILAALGHDADAIAALRAARVVASEPAAWS